MGFGCAQVGTLGKLLGLERKRNKIVMAFFGLVFVRLNSVR